jgi:hypothetical protein
MTIQLRSKTWSVEQDGLIDVEGNFLPWHELDSCEALEVIETCHQVYE